MTKTQILKNIQKMSGIRVYESKTAFYYLKIKDGNVYGGQIEYKKSCRVRDVKYKDCLKIINRPHLFKRIKF